MLGSNKNKKTNQYKTNRQLSNYDDKPSALNVGEGSVSGRHMLFAMSQGWAYELVPSTDERILAIDEDLKELV